MLRRALWPLIVLVVATGCATERAASRGDVIRQIVPSTVQLRCERDGGGKRAASGVFLAHDPQTKRAWIVTTRHFLEPIVPQRVTVHVGKKTPITARVVKVSEGTDLALLEVSGVDSPRARLKDSVRLGDDVWVVAFPFGRRMTVSSGVVSQVTPDAAGVEYEGPAQMVDVSVSYGASGGGVYDGQTGALVGLIKSYRTARVSPPGATPEQTIDVPIPGETLLVPADAIRKFVVDAGLGSYLEP
jgi:S1-C subfamily serine protease